MLEIDNVIRISMVMAVVGLLVFVKQRLF